MLGIGKKSLLAACHRAGVPCYTSSPGDSTIGLNAAGLWLGPKRSKFDFAVTDAKSSTWGAIKQLYR